MNTTNMSSQQSNKRDTAISCTKGLAILMMVMAHGGVCSEVSKFISMFHMPIFFFFSGYCFKDSYLKDNTLFVKKRIKGLYIPYVKWMILFILLHNIFCKLNILDSQSVGYYSVGQIIEKILRTVFTFVGGEQLLGGFWFLRELFWGALISFLLLKYIKNKYIVLVVSFSAALILHYTSWHLPAFGIGYTSFMASCYFTTGYIFKMVKVQTLKPLMVFPAYFIVLIGSLYWSFDAVINSTLLVLPYFITAIVGTWATYSICKLIESHFGNILSFIGNNTMTILTWHFLFFKLVSLLIIALYHMPIDKLGDFPYISEYALKGWWIAYFVVGACFPLLFSCSISNLKKNIVKIS